MQEFGSFISSCVKIWISGSTEIFLKVGNEDSKWILNETSQKKSEISVWKCTYLLTKMCPCRLNWIWTTFVLCTRIQKINGKVILGDFFCITLVFSFILFRKGPKKCQYLKSPTESHRVIQEFFFLWYDHELYHFSAARSCPF